MIRRTAIIVLIVVVGVPVLGMAAYLAMDFLNASTFHQKLTLVVKTPDGTKAGASVTAVTMGSQAFVPGSPGGRGYKHLRGEATVVEIAPGRYLFALLGGQEKLAQKVFADRIGLEGNPAGYPKFEVWLKRLAQLRERREVPEKLYPLLVTFRDIADPKTVGRVDPDNLAASFGPGYALSSITLEITDEKVTKGRVEEVLGWWCDYRKRGARLSGSTSIAISDNELSNNLGTGSFKIGDC